jgi:hypothetical protein
MRTLPPVKQAHAEDALAQEQARLAEEAALRQRSLQRTRKLQARARQRQRQQRAQRLVVVGTLVEACGLLWVEDAQLERLLKAAMGLRDAEDATPVAIAVCAEELPR